MDSSKAVGAGNYRFTAGGDNLDASGVVHLPSRSIAVTITYTEGTERIGLEFLFTVIPAPDVFYDVIGAGA